MATIIDRLREVNRIYKTSVNLDQLNGAKSKLQGIIIDKYIDDNNKHNGLALLCRLNAKIGAIAYFDGGYLEEDYSSLCAILETNLKTAVGDEVFFTQSRREAENAEGNANLKRYRSGQN